MIFFTIDTCNGSTFLKRLLLADLCWNSKFLTYGVGIYIIRDGPFISINISFDIFFIVNLDLGLNKLCSLNWIYIHTLLYNILGILFCFKIWFTICLYAIPQCMKTYYYCEIKLSGKFDNNLNSNNDNVKYLL